jgi:3-oxoacyl-[acyl-carrier protein] reductase
MQDMLDFAGKTVLVVGGSSGIGNGIARSFLAHGASVHVWGTRADASDYHGEEGSDLTGLSYSKVDVSSDSEIAQWPAPFSSLDVLIQCQGIVRYKKREFEMDGFNEVLRVNLSSLMACAIRFHAMLQATRGSMTIVSSTAAFHATMGNPGYNASKAGALGLTRTLAQAWAKDGIRVNGLAPGFVATKLTKVTTDNADRTAEMAARVPMGRFGTPAEMGGVALFLASPLASYVTGHTIPVEGGLLL